MITLFVPEFADGELLSANKLNQLSDSANAVLGAALAPSGIFHPRGVNQTWYLRRRWRYLHVAYSVTVSGESVDVSIDFGTVSNDYTHGSTVSWQWRTFDLNVVGGVAVGAWYGVTVTRDGDDFSFSTEMIIESESANTYPYDVGDYVIPSSWSSGEAVGATKLNTLSDSVMQFANAVNAPAACVLRGTGEGQSYYVKRRGRYLEMTVSVGGDDPDVNFYVHQTKALNDPVTGTYTIDLASLYPAPFVGTWYMVRFEKLAGSGELIAFRELPNAVTLSAPAWNHGESGFLSKINSYTDIVSASYDAMNNIGWQVAAIYRPYDHPRWSIYKHKRYLHYMRNGSTAASIVDPSGENDSVGLKRTTNADPFANYDLDSIDWLAPGGLFYVEEADVVWLDDEP